MQLWCTAIAFIKFIMDNLNVRMYNKIIITINFSKYGSFDCFRDKFVYNILSRILHMCAVSDHMN